MMLVFMVLMTVIIMALFHVLIMMLVFMVLMTVIIVAMLVMTLFLVSVMILLPLKGEGERICNGQNMGSAAGGRH